MALPPTLTAEEIRTMFKARLGLEISQSGVYHYIRRRGFPESTKLGRPTRWLRHPVEVWFTEMSKSLKVK